MEPDLVNGLFEILGSMFIVLSINKLLKDKLVRGIHWGQVGFFTSWGFWNLYFYPHLDQWASFVGGIVLASVNAIYLALLIYYTNQEKK